MKGAHVPWPRDIKHPEDADGAYAEGTTGYKTSTRLRWRSTVSTRLRWGL